MRNAKRPVVQLATRIPAHLRRRAKLAAIAADMTLQDFVVDALEEHLRRLGGGGAITGVADPPTRPCGDHDGSWQVPPALGPTTR